jgi:DNA-directed RNA polymerase subunit M/transcription elongation factor TFIIS
MTRVLNVYFRRGSSTYTCENCGKKTRNTGRGEVDGFCWACTNAMMLENEHSDDGHPEPVKDCPTCEAEENN